MMNINKVVFISVDSLRHSRLGVAGYCLPLTPTLDQLARQGIYCEQTVSHASCTQMAHPPIWTSTLPLDHGGYDTGIMNRTESFVELFQQQGFHTVGFSNCFCLHQFFGYTRGFDTVYPLYDPRRGWQALYANYFCHYLARRRSRLISEQQFVFLALPLFIRALRFFEKLGEQQEALLKSGSFSPPPLFNRIPFGKLRHFCRATLEEIGHGGAAYFMEHLDRFLIPHLFRTAGLSPPPGFLDLFDDRLGNRLNWLNSPFLLPLARVYWDHKRTKRHDASLLLNGAYLIRSISQWLKNLRADRLFLWVGLSDIHELYWGPTSLLNPVHWPGIWSDRVRKGKPHRGSYFYDLSVKYEDSLIGKLLSELNKKWGHLDDVLVVVCSDHGRQWWMDGPRTQRPGRGELEFYEEDVRVPMIFWHRDLEGQRIESLCGLIDLAPTQVDLMGWPRVSAFKGLPVYSSEIRVRPHLILEDAGRGPCDIAGNSLRIAVRTPRYKYIWEEEGVGKPERNELYDLETDPLETRNLHNAPVYQTIGRTLKETAQRRRDALKQSVQRRACE